MSNDIIEKTGVDIYQYPNETYGNKGSVTIGDLHGNALKLVHFLFSHNILKFKNNITEHETAYNDFAQLYDEYGTAINNYITARSALRPQENAIKRLNSERADYDRLSKIARNNEEENTFKRLGKKNFDQELAKLTQEKEECLKKIDDIKAKLPGFLTQFNQFLEQIEVADKGALIRLIGDEVADRGASDYFTLKILEFLHIHRVKRTILVSNHSDEFITAYENLLNNKGFKAREGLDDEDKNSLVGLDLLLKTDLVSEQALKDLIKNVYKPTLKALDYTLSEEGITLFTHAPVPFHLIAKLANKVGVVYDDTSKEALARTIDKINVKFEQYVNSNKVSELLNYENILSLKENVSEQEIGDYPFVALIWNRWDKAKDTAEARPKTHNNYTIHYMHGHDPYPSQFEHVTNLDVSNGKYLREKMENQIQRAKNLLKQEPNAVDAIAFIESIKKYKVINSDEKGLNQSYGVKEIDREFQAKQKENSQNSEVTHSTSRIKKFIAGFAGAGLLIGLGLGIALTLTGILAPLGITILGGVVAAAVLGVAGSALGALSGVFFAKMTEETTGVELNNADDLDQEASLNPGVGNFNHGPVCMMNGLISAQGKEKTEGHGLEGDKKPLIESEQSAAEESDDELPSLEDLSSSLGTSLPGLK